MVRSLMIAVLLALTACPAPTPVTPVTDASDASAFGEASPPSTPCALACAAMQRVGCVVTVDCAATLQAKTAVHMFRNPKSGDWLACADLTGIQTVADVQALGQPCGP